VHREPRVDDLVDDDDVAAADLELEVLQEADALVAARLGGSVARELHEVERVRDRDGAGEVDDERDARLEQADEDRLASLVVAGDLSSELFDPRCDLRRVEVDVADPIVVERRGQLALRSPYRDAIRSKSRS
jgi:hypothetical protein